MPYRIILLLLPLALPLVACNSSGPSKVDATPPAGCTLGEFDCGTGTECIDAQRVCDGNDDCSNGADEQSCGCGAGLFQCTDGQCIPAAFVCDHVMNCSDESDENNCP